MTDILKIKRIGEGIGPSNLLTSLKRSYSKICSTWAYPLRGYVDLFRQILLYLPFRTVEKFDGKRYRAIPFAIFYILGISIIIMMGWFLVVYMEMIRRVSRENSNDGVYMG